VRERERERGRKRKEREKREREIFSLLCALDSLLRKEMVCVRKI